MRPTSNLPTLATSPRPDAVPLSRNAAACRSSDVRDLLRLAASRDAISLAGGLPAPELFDVGGLRLATMAAIDTRGSSAFQYGPTEGDDRLRARLVERERAVGIDMQGRELLVTSGSQQALDLMARLLLDPGDVVLVQRPCYLAGLQVFQLAGATCIDIEDDDYGPRVDLLDRALQDAPGRVKLLYLAPTYGNPSGRTIGEARRREILRWAVGVGVFVLEDDAYGALGTEGPPPPAMLALASEVDGAIDWCGRTSTFSKTVAPGLRIGWLVLPVALAQAVNRIKQAADLHTCTLSQALVLEYVNSGLVESRLSRIRTAYRSRRQALARALRSCFGSSLAFDEPDGGMFIWARFRDATDTRALLAHALQHRVAFVPGDAFHARDPDMQTMRLNFSHATEEQLEEAVKRLHAAWVAMG
jgi:2-aminoadipate transaminase